MAKRAAIQREKVKLDAAGQAVGRLASQIAMILQGKHKATYLPHLDMGDFVEVRNASKVKLTGKKLDQKTYYHYSGYPGGMKTKKLQTVMAKNPAEALMRAVRNMLPKNRLQKPRLKRLKVHND
jgi:large subunit ribosomal protein L13